MIRITAKEVATLMKMKPNYLYTLLRRRKISITPPDLERLIDLILEYRVKGKANGN